MQVPTFALRLTTLAALLAGGGLATAQTLSTNSVNIQLVNDTGYPDSDIYVRIVGKTATNASPTPMVPMNIYTAIGETNAAAATAVPLTTITNTGTLTSTVTGTNVTVYNTEWSNVTSGQWYFQHSTNAADAFVFTGGLQPSTLPIGGANFRFDFAEATVLPNNNNAMDVTYVEKFGFPLKIEWYRGSQLINSAYCHANTTTIAQAFEALGLSPAVFGLSTNGGTNLVNWNSTNSSLTNFARIITPYKTASSAFTFPYPSMSRYLDSLASAGTNYALSSSGYFSSTNSGDTQNRYFVGYDVSFTTNSPATNDPDNPPGWLVTMTYNSNNVPTSNYYTPSQLNPALSPTPIQYTNTLTYVIPYSSATYTVASAPGVPPALKRDGVPLDNDSAWSVELWMTGNVNTALNLGYFGSPVPAVGTNMLDWFLVNTPIDIPRPFAGARTTNTSGAGNDGFYSLYMSLLYKYTDFYGFTYGERYTPEVLFTPQPGDVVRFTILPDERLESPMVTPTDVTTNSVNLTWPSVSNAGGYRIDTLQPLGIAPITGIASNATNFPITNLSPGTPYVFEVRATNTANGNPIESAARPAIVTTAGDFPSTPVTSGDTLIAIPIDNGLDSFQRVQSVTINGTNYPLNSDHIHFYTSTNTPITVPASLGTNQYTLAAYDGSSNVVYYNWLSFELSQVQTTNFALSNAEVYGLAGRFPAPAMYGTNTGNGASLTNFPASSTNAGVQIPVTIVIGGEFLTTPAIPDAVAGGSNNYAQWVSSYYQANEYPNDTPDADPDGDLANNLLEYSRGTDPSTFNSTPGIGLTNSGDTLTYTFARTTNAGDLVWLPSWSTDMTNWTYSNLTNSASTATNASYQMDLGTNSGVFFNADVFLP